MADAEGGVDNVRRRLAQEVQQAVAARASMAAQQAGDAGGFLTRSAEDLASSGGRISEHAQANGPRSIVNEHSRC